ncbi:MAG: hypothetical protein QOE36_2595 [Gaiellaceae bacterium]|jgi:hypothetical protein|nr:hypothetical protein [Gaiellaceae bacterium]
MEEARAVLQRLERIEILDREGAPAKLMLAEVRELLREAEVWARTEGDERALGSVERAGDALAQPVR